LLQQLLVVAAFFAQRLTGTDLGRRKRMPSLERPVMIDISSGTITPITDPDVRSRLL
jgi:hypothetical protein